MAKDDRLDLGRYIQNPFNRRGEIAKQLNFDDLFQSKPESGQYPWNPSRFGTQDLLKRAMTRKINLNPDLNFVGNSPFFDDNSKVTEDYDMFGLGTFDRPTAYNFDEGRANTAQRPQDQPDFDPAWMEAYKLSPTINPRKRAKNPMPRTKNPDPNGYLMAMAENRAEDEVSRKPSIAQLLDRKGVMKPVEVKKDDEAGEKTADDEAGEKTADNKSVETNVSPGKTTA